MVSQPRLTLKEKARFFAQLAVLLNAGISVQRGLEMAGGDCNLALQHCLQTMSTTIAKGKSLGEAIAPYPRTFGEWTIGLIQTAEYSGSLAEVCRRLSALAERQERQGRIYRSAWLTAAGMLLSVLFLLAAMLHLLIPPLFWLFSIGVVGFLLGGAVLLGTRSFDRGIHRLVMGLPMIGKIMEARSMLYLAELEVPIGAGVPLLSAVDLLRTHLPDPNLAASLTEAVRQIRAGQPLSRSLQGKVPSLALQMLRTGEETGDLDAMLQKLSAYYEDELDRMLRQLIGVLRPLSMLIFGLVVLWFGVQLVSSFLKALPE